MEVRVLFSRKMLMMPPAGPQDPISHARRLKESRYKANSSAAFRMILNLIHSRFISYNTDACLKKRVLVGKKIP